MTKTSTLSLEELCIVYGGNGRQCTYGNPKGEYPPRHFVRALPKNHDGRSMSQKVNDAYDRATLPWRVFNGVFGGFNGPRPNIPPPERPLLR